MPQKTGNQSGTEGISSEYRIDGGAWTQFETNGSLVDDFTTINCQQSNLSGSTLEIQDYQNNAANNDRHRIR